MRGMMVAALPLRSDIVAATREWIGTPYRHQASLRGAGCDCLGLVRGIYRTLYGGEPEAIPAYSMRVSDRLGNDRRGGEALMEGLSRHLNPLVAGMAQAGDVLVFRLRGGYPARHAAIQICADKMVHAWERGLVTEAHLSTPWRRRVAFAFSFPDVMD